MPDLVIALFIFAVFFLELFFNFFFFLVSPSKEHFINLVHLDATVLEE